MKNYGKSGEKKLVDFIRFNTDIFVDFVTFFKLKLSFIFIFLFLSFCSLIFVFYPFSILHISHSIP